VSTADAPGKLEEFREHLDSFLRYYQHPRRRIGYGNLRGEYSDWGGRDDLVTNLALIYETPGGSTAQLNITYDHARGDFAYLDERGGGRIVVRDPQEVLKYLAAHINAIPPKRLAALFRQVDAWVDEGMAMGAMFSELNNLIQLEFVGGRITQEELKEGIKHAYERRTGKKFRPSSEAREQL